MDKLTPTGEPAPAGWYQGRTGRVYAAEEVEILADAAGRRYWRPAQVPDAPPAEERDGA